MKFVIFKIVGPLVRGPGEQPKRSYHHQIKHIYTKGATKLQFHSNEGQTEQREKGDMQATNIEEKKKTSIEKQ